MIPERAYQAIYGRVQVLRGMCTDQVDHRFIDARLSELVDVLDQLRQPTHEQETA